MATDLGALFVKSALSPMSYAGSLIMARKVEAGLVELSGNSLLSGVERGILVVAGSVGVPEAEVGRVLPMEALRELAGRVDAAQAVAMKQWKLHTGHVVGGLMDGVADLTVDGRAPDVSLCVLRLARKMRYDKELAEPLTTLSDRLEEWDQLVRSCQEPLTAGGGAIARAYAKRRMRRFGAIGVAGGALITIVLMGGRVWSARRTVDAGLAATPVCAVHGIDEAAVGWASEAQRSAIASRKEQCEAQRAAERKAEAARKAEAKRRREREAKRKKREADCKALAASVAARKLDGPQPALPEAEVARWRRVATGSLTLPDVQKPLTLPCEGLPAAVALRDALARAVIASAGVWVRRYRLSGEVRAALVASAGAVSPGAMRIFTAHIDRLAEGAAVAGDADKLEQAAWLCDLGGALEQPRSPACDAVAKFAAPSP